MMNLLKTLLILFVFASLVSCQDDEGDSEITTFGDYLIFGHYYGLCIGEECVETFKLTTEQLFEDDIDEYAGVGPFNFVAISSAKFELAKDLLSAIPEELIAQENQTFGCPDCGDWGGLYVEYRRSGKIGQWRLDQQDMESEYLNVFRDAVNEKIRLINQ